MKKKHPRPHIHQSLVFALTAALLFDSCATNPTGQVYRDWATSFSQLGIYPIFPPREDVNVGDIYLLPMHPLNTYVIGHMGGLGMTGIHIGYADWNGEGNGEKLAASLEAYYLHRSTFPDGPTGGPLVFPTNSTSATNKSSANSLTNNTAKGKKAGTNSTKNAESRTSSPPRSETNSVTAASMTTNASPSISSSATNQSSAVISSGVSSTNAAEAKTNEVVMGQETNKPSSGTNQAVATAQDVPVLPKAPPDARTNIFDPLGPIRLREVAFPEFAFTKINEASAAGAAPVEGVLVNAGFDVSKVNQITVKIPVAESYGMPVGSLLQGFFTNDLWQDTVSNTWFIRASPSHSNYNVLTTPAGEMAREMFTRSLQTAIDDTYPAWPHWITHHKLETRIQRDSNCLYLALITEVFYTRSIDMVVSGTSAFAAGASAAPVSPAQVQQWMGLSKGSTNSTTTTTTNSNSGGSSNVTTVTQSVASSSGAAENSDPFAVADKLRTMSLGYSNGIGGSVRILGVSAHNVALQRVFEHPIAIGVRGVVMRISATAELLPANVVSFTGSTNDRPIRGYRIALYGQSLTER